MRGLFVTGTDTGVGKTRRRGGAAAIARQRGRARRGHEAGRRGVRRRRRQRGRARARGRRERRRAASPIAIRIAFADAVAPHLAAASQRAATIDLVDDRRRRRRGLRRRRDVLIVEGAGGALVPLDARHDMLDVAVMLGLPVLLVVGMRLGCLNHALLSALAIRRRGLELRGWVANRLPAPMAFVDAQRRRARRAPWRAASPSSNRPRRRCSAPTRCAARPHGAKAASIRANICDFSTRASTPTRVFSARNSRARGESGPQRHIVIGDSMGNRRGLAVRRCPGFAVLLSLFASGAAFAAWEWNFQPPATPIARKSSTCTA